jgi:nicotinic acid mononucleotide adenylyltransferase
MNNINYTKDNTFIFSFVRMNPPTPGHLVLIKTMIDKALELGTNKAYVITSSSMDGKNPLACSRETIPSLKKRHKDDMSIIINANQPDTVYKLSILEQMINSYKEQLAAEELDLTKRSLIENFQIIVLCSTGNPFGFIYNTVKNYYLDKGIQKINMIFIVGRDRADFLDTIVDNFMKNQYVNSIDGIILEREGMESLKTSGLGERNIADLKPSEISASFIRKLVDKDKKDDFGQIYGKYISPDDIQKLFNTIKIGIQMKTPSSKSEEENPESKYFDSQSLPIINTGSQKKGGSIRRKSIRRKSIRNKRKSRRNKRKSARNKRRNTRKKLRRNK